MHLAVADACFVKDNDDQQLAKVPVDKLMPANLLLSVRMDEEGNNAQAVSRLSHFIKSSGYSQLAH